MPAALLWPTGEATGSSCHQRRWGAGLMMTSWRELCANLKCTGVSNNEGMINYREGEVNAIGAGRAMWGFLPSCPGCRTYKQRQQYHDEEDAEVLMKDVCC